MGWWVGYRIDDLEAWDKIKKGEYNMFSIEGQGQRISVEKKKGCAKSFFEIYEHKRPKRGKTAKSFLEIYQQDDIIKGARSFLEVYLEKFNPYHDTKGRFSSRGGFVSFSPGNNPTQAQRSIDRENKYRQGEGISGTVGGAFGNAERMTHAQVRRRLEELKNRENEKSSSAKTLKAAKRYAVDTLGFNEIKFNGLSLESVNFINKHISIIQEQFPETKGAVSSLKIVNQNKTNAPIAYVSTYGSGRMELSINKKFFEDINQFDEDSKKAAKSGWTVGENAQSTIWHEYGHVLATIKTKELLGETREGFITSIKTHSYETDIINKVSEKTGVKMSNIGQSISRYADTSAGETFAEAVSDVFANPSPKKISIAIVREAGLMK